MKKNIDKILLSQIEVIKANAKTCEDYINILPKIKEIENLIDNEEKDASEVIEEANEKMKKVLYAEFKRYGFFDLPKVKNLSDSNKEKLIESINKNQLPCKIAMIDYLGFISHLEMNHFDSKAEMHKKIAKWFCSDKLGRSVRGNINSLSKKSKENKTRYTAYKCLKEVKNFYIKLK
jgi:hypothetical protein